MTETVNGAGASFDGDIRRSSDSTTYSQGATSERR